MNPDRAKDFYMVEDVARGTGDCRIKVVELKLKEEFKRVIEEYLSP